MASAVASAATCYTSARALAAKSCAGGGGFDQRTIRKK